MSLKLYMFKYTIVNGSYNNFVLASTLKAVRLIIKFSLIWLWKCKKKVCVLILICCALIRGPTLMCLFDSEMSLSP